MTRPGGPQDDATTTPRHPERSEGSPALYGGDSSALEAERELIFGSPLIQGKPAKNHL